MKKANKMKDFAVTLQNNAAGQEMTKLVEVTAQNEKSAAKKAMKTVERDWDLAYTAVAKIEPAWNQEIFDAAVAGKDTNKMLKIADKKAVKAAKAVKFDFAAATKKNLKTIKNAEQMLGLTEKQAKAMNYLIKSMAGHKDSEPTFSDVGVKEICDLFESPFVGGAVISTLIEKGLITKHDAPTDNRDVLGKWVICFTEKSQSMR